MAKKKGRMVKCFATGEIGNSLDYVHHGNHWWKSEEVYKAYGESMMYRRKAYDLYGDIINYESWQIFPSYVHKRFMNFKQYGWECIYKNMLQCEESMRWAIAHKDFANSIAQTAYLFAIMNSSINETYGKLKKEKAEAALAAKKAAEATKYEEDVDLSTAQTAPKQKRDISKWLDD